jgi:hypothetical protein
MTPLLTRLVTVTATALLALVSPAAAGAAIGPGSTFTLMPPYNDVTSQNSCTGLCFSQTGAAMGDLRAGTLGPGGAARAALTLNHQLDQAARSIAYTVTFQQQLGQFMPGSVLLEVKAIDRACSCGATTSIPLPPPSPTPVTVPITLSGALTPGQVDITTALVIPTLSATNPGAMATGSVSSIRGQVS